MHQMSIDTVRSDALFVSALQGSDEPSAAQVQRAIVQAVREFGARGCAGRVAQEFGDHPEMAVARMRWARHKVDEVFRVAGLRAARVRLFASSRLAHTASAA